jgi:hypothetical protein
MVTLEINIGEIMTTRIGTAIADTAMTVSGKNTFG